jgi:hypothetical protein
MVPEFVATVRSNGNSYLRPIVHRLLVIETLSLWFALQATK